IAHTDVMQKNALSFDENSTVRTAVLNNTEVTKELLKHVFHSEWDEFYYSYKQVKWMSVGAGKKESLTDEGKSLLKALQDTNASMKEKLKKIADIFVSSYAQMLSDSFVIAEIFEGIVKLADELEEEILKAKIEKNCIDFADAELIAVDLIVKADDNGKLTRTKLCEEIVKTNRYKVIIIDEFQDVNNLQDVIFKSVSNTDDLGIIGDNVFVVGDVKQAIYRFRHANPAIFIETRKQAKSGKGNVEEILLRNNFRSRKNILDFANYIMHSVMSEEIGELEYTDDEELKYGASYGGEDSPCDIIIVNPDELDGEDKLEAAEYRAIARRIKQMLNEKVQVTDGDGTRDCKPSDFCVIARNNMDSTFIECFENEGLSVSSSESKGYLKSLEIMLLTNLLSVISNPMNDIALAAVMVSPLMCFNDTELATVKIHNKRSKIYKNMLQISKEAENPLAEKCLEAVSLIKKLRVYASSLTVSRLIKKVYDVTDLISIASVYQDGKQKSANLNLMLEYARNYEESSSDGLSGFMRYLSYVSKNDNGFKQAIIVSEYENAVNVKTMHGSKGLEFPFVFLCRLDKQFNKKDLSERLLLNLNAGVAITYLDYTTLTKHKTALSKYLNTVGISELLSEELRLLYVALTRAKERLSLVLSIGEQEKQRISNLAMEICKEQIQPFTVKKAVCMQDWICLSLSKHPEFKLFEDDLGGVYYKTDINQAPKINIMPPLEDEVEINGNDETILPNLNLVENIKDTFAFEYDDRLVDKDAKISVSEIVKDDSLTFFPQVPKLGDTLEELSATQKGTVMHRFMQLANYENAENDVEAELQRLVKLNAFTVKEASGINTELIAKFFETDIYSRMKQSENVMREKSFIVKMSDIKLPKDLQEAYANTDGMLQGIADCIFEESDGYIIVDYKTDRVNQISKLLELYSMQLGFYKAAFDILLDKPIKSAYIYSLQLAQGVEAQIEEFS
ncbi:MAG: UvrD-helicase domain-containing protein, partial [Oscillospiraceae bacterium]|nr:UvrD-helicase domain-containing protein [Oscillospiraceae bacterium]